MTMDTEQTEQHAEGVEFHLALAEAVRRERGGECHPELGDLHLILAAAMDWAYDQGAS